MPTITSQPRVPRRGYQCHDHRYRFTGGLTVRFGTTATVFTVNSATQITAVAPAGTGTMQVTVTTSGGTSNGVADTYVPIPTLTTVVPNVGPVAGGTTVVLTGANLSGLMRSLSLVRRRLRSRSTRLCRSRRSLPQGQEVCRSLRRQRVESATAAPTPTSEG
ncbi:IPT/TIG domain-containing protein [Nocardia sp. KC 131]|uniref:IPT/TIG domain-containing protein n=1 Tax=Nocardia arseniciresistens TaxID=3392119 RepID=UPI00398E416A